jgi:hypothetical protein
MAAVMASRGALGLVRSVKRGEVGTSCVGTGMVVVDTWAGLDRLTVLSGNVCSLL